MTAATYGGGGAGHGGWAPAPGGPSAKDSSQGDSAERTPEEGDLKSQHYL